MPSDEAARCRSSSRVVLVFCVPHPLVKAGEINHEAHEGHEEFARERRTNGLSHNRNLAYIACSL